MDRGKKPASIGIGGSIPQPTVNINDNGTIDAKLPSGESVTVHLFGATVISWKLATGAEQLFVSSKAILDGSKAIRGGIPVVFPVFGPPPPNHATSSLPQHGFARSSNWEYLGKSSSESLGNKADTTVKLDFGLSSSMISEEFRKAWPYEFGLVYSVTLSPDRLETSLQVQNKGSESFDFHVLLHNYFKVPDVSKIAVTNLQNKIYIDKVDDKKEKTETTNEITITGETDRVYLDVDPSDPVSIVENGQPLFTINRKELNTVTVWNPWVENAKKMSDFGDEEYKGMTDTNSFTAVVKGLRYGPPIDKSHQSVNLTQQLTVYLPYWPAVSLLAVVLSIPSVWHHHQYQPQYVIEEEDLPTPPLLEVENEEYVADNLNDENNDNRLIQNGHNIILNGNINNDDGSGRGSEPESEEKEKPISWSQLPKKSQLLILVLARLSEPLTQTSLQAYLFYQLKSFDSSLPDSAISRQAGIFQGSFTAAQFLTSVWWGRAAVRTGSAGNEFYLFQSRAFLLLPMCFNVGVIIGPSLGGFLAEPVTSFPGLFGPGSLLGGKDGIWWMRHWPYALPNLVSAVFIISAWAGIFFGLEETHEVLRHRPDWGRAMGSTIAKRFRRNQGYRYRRLDDDERSVFLEDDDEAVPPNATTMRHPEPLPIAHKRSTWKQLLTRNVVLTVLTHSLLAMHTSAFNAMTFVFLPTPRAPEDSRRGFFHFNGGLGLTTQQVGIATSVIGLIGLPLQLFVYPRVQFRLGTLRSLRSFLPLSPLAYTLMPFLVLIPRGAQYLIWPSFSFVVALQVLSRTFVLPAAIILVNNSVSDPSVLGTIHGVAQSISSGSRTLGPFLGGLGLSLGLSHNIIGAVWWALAVEALLGWLVSWSIFEGEGIQRKIIQEEALLNSESEEERR
uniref:Glucose-6-phosphate 1-epimerase n=1 Tax=Talaromyces marneffei PM1 TaxID=1077442 RepID=A0A093Y3V9_TALMA